MKTKEIDIEKFWGSPAKVLIKKFTMGDVIDIQNLAPTDPMGNPLKGNFAHAAMLLITLQKAIISAPFMSGEKLTDEEARNIEADIGQFILEEIDTFNTIPPN